MIENQKNTLEKSLFFAGGKTIFPETNEKTDGLKFKNLGDGTWQVTLDIIITKTEAEGIIHKYSDFAKLEDEEVFDETFPNQVYFEAFEDNGGSKSILFSRIQLNVLNAQKTELGGEIMLRLTPVSGIGKTQNASSRKTQNVGTIIGRDRG